MDKKTLLIFAKRIFDSSSKEKATRVLEQLRAILIEQGVKSDCIGLIDTMISDAPEMKEIAAQKPFLTEEDIKIAERRADERRAREALAASQGRC